MEGLPVGAQRDCVLDELAIAVSIEQLAIRAAAGY